jgi:hypothetical protein
MATTGFGTRLARSPESRTGPTILTKYSDPLLGLNTTTFGISTVLARLKCIRRPSVTRIQLAWRVIRRPRQSTATRVTAWNTNTTKGRGHIGMVKIQVVSAPTCAVSGSQPPRGQRLKTNADHKAGAMRFSRWSGRGILIAAALILGVAAVSGSVLGSNSSPAGDPTAIQTCQAITGVASQYGTITGLLRAETSTAGAVAYWQENRARTGPASFFRTLPTGMPVTVCMFSGQFSTPAGPPAPDGSPKAIPNALRLLAYGSQVVFDSAGDQSGMSPEMPSDISTATS